ncbi:MAG TPA: carboxypeptidase regulatory-like domain-containing protein [Candidatus Angelobacter sp.]|nr:carboxypeptidase regulatory-like domain-containing protein [Candidatus Angelobacter sp.]
MRKIAFTALLLLFLAAISAHASPGGEISGTVKNEDGSPFRAAFVRAQNVKTKMLMMVLTDNQGQYRTDSLPAGTYEVSVTSTGYRGDPSRRTDITVEDGKDTSANFTMKKGTVQWNQLTKYQAGILLPEGKGKDVVLQECFNCHAMSRIGVTGRDRDGWLEAIEHMRQVGVADIKPDVASQASEYLAAVFGPDADTPAPSKLPQYEKVKQEHDYFSDDALKIVYVDYQLTGEPKDRPGTGKPDKDGNIWMEMGGGLSKLNPATGELHTWRLPDPTRPFIHEILPTPDGSVWLTIERQNALARFDTRTETFEVFKQPYGGPPPVEMEPNAPWPNLRYTAGGQTGDPRRHTAVIDHQGNIWSSGRPLSKFDVETKKFTFFPEVPDTYGIAVDKDGNVWFAEFNSRDHRSIGMVDVKTNKVTKWTPPNSDTRPRRLKIDSQGMIWFGDYFGGNLTRFDPKTHAFKEFKLPGPMPTPYGISVDHNDHLWYASMYTDVMGMLDPKTGKVIEYPSPYGERGTRDMFEDAQGRIWYGAQPYGKVGYVRVRTDQDKAVAQK